MKQKKIYWPGFFCWIMYPVCMLIAAAVGLFPLLSCSPTEKVVYEHIHHYQQADTMATEAASDTHVTETSLNFDSIARSVFNEYSASWFSHEDNREVTTETITTTVDSLGRQIRTEQRTTERNLSKLQQQTEQRLTQEYEQRLQMAIQQQDSVWQERMSRIQAHWEQQFDNENSSATKTEHQPWYTRLWNRLQGYLLCIAVAALLFLTRGLWWPWCINLFRKK